MIETEKSTIICEVLKVLFNLTVNSTESDKETLENIANVIKNLLRMRVADNASKMNIVSNSINVVTNMESKQVSVLIQIFCQLTRTTCS